MSDIRVEIQQAHAFAAQADELGRHHRARRDRMICTLYASGREWTHPRIAALIDVSPELVAKVVRAGDGQAS